VRGMMPIVASDIDDMLQLHASIEIGTKHRQESKQTSTSVGKDGWVVNHRFMISSETHCPWPSKADVAI
jgi:hypothetical protein